MTKRDFFFVVLGLVISNGHRLYQERNLSVRNKAAIIEAANICSDKNGMDSFLISSNLERPVVGCNDGGYYFIDLK